MPSWDRGFINVIRTFVAANEVDQMIAADIAAEVREAKNRGVTQRSRYSGAVVLFREDTCGIHPRMDEEAA